MFVIYAQIGTPNPTPDYDEVAIILRQSGHTVWVATPNDSRELLFNDGNIDVASIEMPNASQREHLASPLRRWFANLRENWMFILRLRELIRRTQPDVVQVNQAKLPFLWLLPLGIWGRTRFVLDWRQIAERPFSGKLAKLRTLLHLLRRRVPSRYIYSRACFLHPAGAARILGEQWEKWGTVVPLAVSPRFLNAELHNIESSLGDGSQIRFIYIGSLSRVRRLERIIQAAKQIQEKSDGHREFSICFIGPDKAQGFYQRFVEDLGLNSVVEILPPVPYSEVPDLLTRSDVALAYIPENPLDWRYHPTLKVMEYRAIGIPIIATDFEPNRAVVEDGRNGLLVKNNVESLAKALHRFVDDPDFLHCCTLSAQEMRQGLLWKDVTRMYERLYLQLVKQGK